MGMGRKGGGGEGGRERGVRERVRGKVRGEIRGVERRTTMEVKGVREPERTRVYNCDNNGEGCMSYMGLDPHRCGVGAGTDRQENVYTDDAHRTHRRRVQAAVILTSWQVARSVSKLGCMEEEEQEVRVFEAIRPPD